MAKFDRRFTKSEFKTELLQHLRDMPPGFLKVKGNLEAHVEAKSLHYERAMQALDEAVARLNKVRSASIDSAIQDETDAVIRKIEEAANAYGSAALSFNSQWIFNNDTE